MENDNFELGSQGGNIETYFDTIELDGPNPSLSQPAGVVNQQWRHVALVYDKDSAAEVALYVDGQLSAQRGDWGGNFDSSGNSTDDRFSVFPSETGKRGQTDHDGVCTQGGCNGP